MKIIRAEHLGMCFGVRDAIALAEKHAEAAPLTVLGDLVHNEAVLSKLRDRGITIQQQPERVKTQAVMVTAHGASERALANARALGLQVLQATCPLVHLAHRSVANLVKQGFHPIIVGQREHVEVRGLTEDLLEYDVMLAAEDVQQLRERSRFGIAAQTTQPIERVRHLVWLVCQRFPAAEVRFVDTVCQPTKQRQNAATELALTSGVVIVIGGTHSNNTRELVSAASKHCARVYHVQSADDLRPEWFSGEETVGVTAGTSTPDFVIEAVENRLQRMSAAVSA